MKFLIHIICIAILGIGWVLHLNKGSKVTDEKKVEMEEALYQEGFTEDEVNEKLSELKADESENIFSGVLLTFLTAGYAGTVFVIYLLPMFVHQATQSVYDSGEQLGDDPMHDARSKLAQGDYAGAVTKFYEAAKVDPFNRLPYVEISKLQRFQLEDSDAAIATLTKAIEEQSWEENDAAFLMFRLAEIYQEDKKNVGMASAVMQQVIDQFPETRHSANALHKLQEWRHG